MMLWCSTRPQAPRFRVEVSERYTYLHVCKHRGVADVEPAILSATAPPIGEYVEERIFVALVVTFAKTFHAVLAGGSEAIVRLATQPDESVAAPLHIELRESTIVDHARRSKLRAIFPVAMLIHVGDGLLVSQISQQLHSGSDD